jgi:hypothetical protein
MIPKLARNEQPQASNRDCQRSPQQNPIPPAQQRRSHNECGNGESIGFDT